MAYIKSLTGIINTGSTVLCQTNTDLGNVIIDSTIIKFGTLASVGGTIYWYFDSTSTASVSSSVIVPNDGTPVGRWRKLVDFGTIAGGIVIFDSGSSSANLRSARTSNQSPIDNTKNGIVNLSSKTTGSSFGTTGNYSSILGGDQNSATASYSTVLGGLNNLASGSGSVASGLNSVASRTGEVAQASGKFTVAGDVQTSTITLFNNVTSSSLTELFIDGISEVISLPVNCVYGFNISVSAYAHTAQIAGYWHFKGAIKSNNSGTLSIISGSIDKTSVLDDDTWDSVVDVSSGHFRIRTQAASSDNTRTIALVQLVQTKF